MRIIAGLLKGKKLFSPKTEGIRPTSDRMREAIFSILGDELLSANVLDLFAGTGALGLEALSRGASFCVFVDNSPSTISLIQKNIDTCELVLQADIYQKDASSDLSFLIDQAPFSLVFIDPPYEKIDFSLLFQQLHDQKLLQKGALLVLETSVKEIVFIPERFFSLIKRRTYGKSRVSFFEYMG